MVKILTINYQQLSFKLLTCIFILWSSYGAADISPECNNGSGANSTECGSLSNTSNGESATAIGASATAVALQSTAVGHGTEATDQSSTAIGYDAAATGESSSAIGASTVATDSLSTAVGDSAKALGFRAIALGASSGATEQRSIAVGGTSMSAGGVALGGFMNDDSSPASIAIGISAEIFSNSKGAIAIGSTAYFANDKAWASGENAMAIGYKARANQPGAIAFGANVEANKAHTMSVGVPIEVIRDETAKVLVEDTSSTTLPRTLFEISNKGNTKFTVTNSDANEQWSFANPGTGFRLSRQGSGVVEFEVKNNGNAVLAGTLTENSDINSKHDIQWLNQEEILDKVMSLPIAQWRYNDAPDSKHIGPMAQDFYQAFGLGDTDKGISTLDSSGVALASIQALNVRLDNKEQELADLKQLNQELMDRLDKLEGQLTEVNN